MTQTRLGSLVESVVNTVLGLGIAMVATHAISTHYGFPLSVSDNFTLTSWMTVISVGRSYLLRRLFNSKLALWCAGMRARYQLRKFQKQREAEMRKVSILPPHHLNCPCSYTPLANEREVE